VAHDLLAISLQDAIKKELKKGLNFMDDDDDTFEVMFKYLEIMKAYIGDVESLH
jgi:hypothetical protein